MFLTSEDEYDEKEDRKAVYLETTGTQKGNTYVSNGE